MSSTEKHVLRLALDRYIYASECEDTKEGSIKAKEARRLKERLVFGHDPDIPRDILHDALQLLRDEETAKRAAAALNLLIIDNIERSAEK